jgi:hypothetical protein
MTDKNVTDTPEKAATDTSWFETVALCMADGTSLADALKRHGITLDKSEIRALYRNAEFRRLYQEARYQHQHSDLYFNRPLTREERFRRML